MPGKLRVAVADPVAAVRNRITTALVQSGHCVDEVSNFAMWARGAGIAAAVNLDDRDSAELMRTLRRVNPTMPIVALVSRIGVERCAQAMRLGATALAQRSDAAGVVLALDVAARGGLVIPPDLWRELVRPRGAEAPRLGPDDAALLRLLASGVPVKELASLLFVAERTAYRRIRSLLRKLDVQTREGALVRAGRLGLISERDCVRPGAPPSGDRV